MATAKCPSIILVPTQFSVHSQIPIFLIQILIQSISQILISLLVSTLLTIHFSLILFMSKPSNKRATQKNPRPPALTCNTWQPGSVVRAAGLCWRGNTTYMPPDLLPQRPPTAAAVHMSVTQEQRKNEQIFISNTLFREGIYSSYLQECSTVFHVTYVQYYVQNTYFSECLITVCFQYL